MTIAAAPARSRQHYEASELAIQATALPFASRTAKLRDFVELTKPRISFMVLITVTVGYTLGTHGVWEWSVLAPALLGIALIASASTALNQLLERHTDARMERTAGRPLPSGRLLGTEVFGFAVACAVTGGLVLTFLVNPLTAALTLLTLVLYAGCYTPLKRHTSLCTTVGAVPGALPPVLGWTAAGGALDSSALALFAILFLWQFPHFLAIAWLYRQQYDAAGLVMLPRSGPRVVGLLATTYAVALIPVSLLPRSIGLAGDFYLYSALGLGVIYLAASIRFTLHESRVAARSLMWSSLVYLPAVLLILMYDHLQLLS